MSTVNVRKISSDQNGNTVTDWFQFNGVDFGTEYKFDNEIFGIVWTANQYQIVDEDNSPVTIGDFNHIAVNNSLRGTHYLTRCIQ